MNLFQIKFGKRCIRALIQYYSIGYRVAKRKKAYFAIVDDNFDGSIETSTFWTCFISTIQEEELT